MLIRAPCPPILHPNHSPLLRAVHLGPSGVDFPNPFAQPSLLNPLRNCIAPGRPFRAVWSSETIPSSNLPPRTLLDFQPLRAVHLGPSEVKTLAHFPLPAPNPPSLFLPLRAVHLGPSGVETLATHPTLTQPLPLPSTVLGRPFRTVWNGYIVLAPTINS